MSKSQERGGGEGDSTTQMDHHNNLKKKNQNTKKRVTITNDSGRDNVTIEQKTRREGMSSDGAAQVLKIRKGPT